MSSRYPTVFRELHSGFDSLYFKRDLVSSIHPEASMVWVRDWILSFIIERGACSPIWRMSKGREDVGLVWNDENGLPEVRQTSSARITRWGLWGSIIAWWVGSRWRSSAARVGRPEVRSRALRVARIEGSKGRESKPSIRPLT